MPIYAYKCASCGYAKDVLQKISDAPLTVCPHCGASEFHKQLTAAGFQLKGSGWYVTDFRGGDAGSKAPAVPDEAAAGGAAKAEPSSAPAPAPAPAAPESKPSAGGGAKSEAAPAPTPAPAGGATH